MHPSWDVIFQTGRQTPDLRGRNDFFGPEVLARRLLYLDRLRNVLLPPRETFCWTERVQERKGLYAFFYARRKWGQAPIPRKRCLAPIPGSYATSREHAPYGEVKPSDTALRRGRITSRPCAPCCCPLSASPPASPPRPTIGTCNGPSTTTACSRPPASRPPTRNCASHARPPSSNPMTRPISSIASTCRRTRT